MLAGFFLFWLLAFCRWYNCQNTKGQKQLVHLEQPIPSKLTVYCSLGNQKLTV